MPGGRHASQASCPRVQGFLPSKWWCLRYEQENRELVVEHGVQPRFVKPELLEALSYYGRNGNP